MTRDAEQLHGVLSEKDLIDLWRHRYQVLEEGSGKASPYNPRLKLAYFPSPGSKGQDFKLPHTEITTLNDTSVNCKEDPINSTS